MMELTDAILNMQREALGKIAEMRTIPGCEIDQAELLHELLIVANAAQELDTAMSSGHALPTPWQRSADYRNR
jgi:hypothetical protein